jgi:hypothetical protein
MTTATAARAEHKFNRIDSDGGWHRLTCECGWTTPLARTGGPIGAEWDKHRIDSELRSGGDDSKMRRA